MIIANDNSTKVIVRDGKEITLYRFFDEVLGWGWHSADWDYQYYDDWDTEVM